MDAPLHGWLPPPPLIVLALIFGAGLALLYWDRLPRRLRELPKLTLVVLLLASLVYGFSGLLQLAAG